MSNDAILFGMSATMRRGNETIDQAFDRIKMSKYVLYRYHREYGNFFETYEKCDKIFVGVNTAHLFYKKLYGSFENRVTYDDNGDVVSNDSLLTCLELFLLSLSKTITKIEDASFLKKFLDEWSDSMHIMMR